MAPGEKIKFKTRLRTARCSARHFARARMYNRAPLAISRQSVMYCGCLARPRHQLMPLAFMIELTIATANDYA